MSKGKLTPEQIKNWRQVLSFQLGPAAMFCSDEMIQRVYEVTQEKLDTERRRTNPFVNEKPKRIQAEKVQGFKLGDTARIIRSDDK